MSNHTTYGIRQNCTAMSRLRIRIISLGSQIPVLFVLDCRPSLLSAIAQSCMARMAAEPVGKRCHRQCNSAPKATVQFRRTEFGCQRGSTDRSYEACCNESTRQRLNCYTMARVDAILLQLEETEVNAGKLDLFYFGDIGKEDAFNPAYVCAQEYAAETLFLIASRAPYELSQAEIARLLGVELETVRPVIDSLQRIKAIECREDTYRICFPAFLRGDVQQMEDIFLRARDSIAGTLERLKSQLVPIAQQFRCRKQFSVGRILYHVICDSVFDDMAFAYFEKERLLVTSKPQPGDRDYLIIGYEACEEVARNSDLLLCSSNNYACDGVRFNSFGDSDGRRRDMYRFTRVFDSEPRELVQFLDRADDIEVLLSSDVESIASRCSSIVKGIVSNDVYWTDLTDDAEMALLLSELGYISGRQENNHISMTVPVFYQDERSFITAVADIVLPQIDSAVKQAFDSFSMRAGDLTAVRHTVDIEEIGNELWHQIFGLTNEDLARTGFVDKPQRVDGQGRFFRSIRIES